MLHPDQPPHAADGPATGDPEPVYHACLTTDTGPPAARPGPPGWPTPWAQSNVRWDGGQRFEAITAVAAAGCCLPEAGTDDLSGPFPGHRYARHWVRNVHG